ncbi:MAG TPA: MBL fold metallo-hydrolase [Vicinamibacterales bacterium]|jgi:competence protein ComEC|nr:MBL fold metallo-hydrolase [Vicinamibacterales bacterium]
MRQYTSAVVIVLATGLLSGQTRSAKTLNIYVVDVEGGNATLAVAPSGESLLIDTGNAGAGAVRDATRILSAARDAGVSRIDHLIITHWHGDHYGGLTELAARIPIAHFIDHGPNAQPNRVVDDFLKDTYPKLHGNAKHTIAKPGDRVTLGGVDVRVVTSAGQVLSSPLAGAGSQNPYCASFKPGDNNAEDPQSVGSLITFGRFRTIHLGDLTKNKEFELMCPSNRVGTVDVLLGLHHGQDTSNSEVLVHALRPRVAVMNNGTRKGGLPEVMKTVYTSPGLEDLWQIHFSVLSGQEFTMPGLFIANWVDEQAQAMPIEPVPLPAPGPNVPPPPAHDGAAYWIKVSAQEDGTFTVTNARNGFSKVYAPK